MLGETIRLQEAPNLCRGGPKAVSRRHFGKRPSRTGSDRAARVRHAERRWPCDVAAGGSRGAPRHASIDHNRACEQYKQLVAPRLWGGEAGGSWFTPAPGPSFGLCGRIPGCGRRGLTGRGGAPGVRSFVTRIRKRNVGSIGVDVNHVSKPRNGRRGRSRTGADAEPY